MGDTKERERAGGEERPGEAGGTSRRVFLKTTGLAAAGLALACGGSGDTPPPPDAGEDAPPSDAGGDVGVDAGVDAGRDAGVDADVDADVDAGPGDAGEDAGVDAGRDADGGAGSDAGMDAAADAGADAGAEDADVDAGSVEGPEGVSTTAAFDLGVASGDVTPDAAILWTRYTLSAPLRLVVYEMSGDRYVRELVDVDLTPADGGFVHHEVTGLAPGRRYRYVFFVMSGAVRAARSPIGRFRAALAPTAMEPLVVGGCSCTSNGRSMATLERAGERDDIDLFLLNGDTTYNDSASSLADYRGKWAENLGTAGYRALRASTSVLATWDDHEVDNDFNPETIGAARLASARQAFFENLPLRRDATDAGRIWKRMRWGLTADIFVLDSRGERLPSTRGGADVYLSRAQMDWLKAELSASPAVFKLIMNSVPITNFPGLFDLAANDRWEGYPTQRNEILDHIDGGITGVVWLSGDFHLASMGRVDKSGSRGATQIEVLMGPGAQTANPLWVGLDVNENFDWSSGTNNYTTLELRPASGEVVVRFHDGAGSVFQERTYVP